MRKKRHIHASDFRALTQLATDAAIGITDLVEAMHASIVRIPGAVSDADRIRTRGISGFVYKTVRNVTRIAGTAAEAALAHWTPPNEESRSSPERDAVLAALNGVLGDTMAAKGNPLAIPMQFRQNGEALTLTPAALRERFPHAGGKLLVLLHGLCMNDLQWQRQGHDHGATLASEFGYTPLYLRYNSGLHVSSNGHAYANLLQELVQHWPQPVEEITMVCHSMGGLVARSAYHYATLAQHAWPQQLRKLVFLGTPHHGAPLERIGNWVDVILHASPYAAPIARLGKIRSAGITDLRHGSLLDEDWEGRDRFARAPDQRGILPLPEGLACYAVAATLGKKTGDLGDRLLGDGLVPLDSALGRHRDPARQLSFAPGRQWIGVGMGHLDLLNRAEVYEQLREWMKD